MRRVEPLRVAVVLGHWQNYGVETLVMNLYRNIDRSRVQFDFVVCETPESGIPREEIESLGGRLYIVPPYSRLPEYERALTDLFRRNGYRIVHAHMSTLCPLPLRAAKRAGVPVRIARCHTMAGRGEHAKNAAKYALRLLAHAYPTHYATSSLMAGRWLFGDRVADSGEMYYLPVARNIEAFRFDPTRRAEVRAELGLEGKFVIGHLGRFVPQKNHAFLIELFDRVHREEPAAHLLLAGDGPLVGEVMTRVNSLGLTDSVSYLGRRSDAPDLYQAMDVFVLPSIYEGVPGTGIEAQAAGLPFVFADTVTDEAKILESSKRLSLDDIDNWVSSILGMRLVARTDTVPEMVEAGYSIKNAAASLSDYYLYLVV
ncbi:glycosyltransferase [Collinsella tanakaei]|nr:glycosyltransferase [Collinsella tanakaei]